MITLKPDETINVTDRDGICPYCGQSYDFCDCEVWREDDRRTCTCELDDELPE